MALRLLKHYSLFGAFNTPGTLKLKVTLKMFTLHPDEKYYFTQASMLTAAVKIPQ